jgi:hypothetical protein
MTMLSVLLVIYLSHCATLYCVCAEVDSMDLFYHCAILSCVRAKVGSIALLYHCAILYCVKAEIGTIALIITVLACTVCAGGGGIALL